MSTELKLLRVSENCGLQARIFANSLNEACPRSAPNIYSFVNYRDISCKLVLIFESADENLWYDRSIHFYCYSWFL